MDKYLTVRKNLENVQVNNEEIKVEQVNHLFINDMKVLNEEFDFSRNLPLDSRVSKKYSVQSEESSKLESEESQPLQKVSK